MDFTATSRNRLIGVAALLLLPAAQAMTLSEALQLSVTHDPTVPGSLALYEADREAAAADRARRRPSLSVEGAAAYAQTESTGVFGTAKDGYTTWDASVRARQPLFRLDWFALGDRADARDRYADESLNARKLMLLRRVAERYFAVMLGQDELAQAEAEEKAVRESLDDTQKRYDVELVAGTDLKEARARHDLAQAQLFASRRALENAYDTLEETTGRRREVLPKLSPDVGFPPLTPADAEAWVAAAREHSPDIILAREAAIVAKANATTAAADTLPVLDLVASAGRNDNSEYRFGQKVDDARVGVQLSIPLYAGGAYAARRSAADAQARGAEADLQRIVRETERTTRQLYGDVETRYYEAQAYKLALESAEAAETATRHGYDAGTRTITDVLDAKSRAVQARRNLNRTRYNLLLNLLQLKQIVGSLSEQDFAEIDAVLAESHKPTEATQ
ncbi:MAG TPA: TolC family outer membrane protein [Solimonas sp.]|nr:TolC family outer membrane protein [Solimonas sp.]